MKTWTFVAAAVLVTALNQPATAEIELGIKGGINSANVSSDSDDILTKSRKGLVGGASLYIHGDGRIGLQAEVLYTMKGFAFDEPDLDVLGIESVTFDMPYIEIPLLLRAELSGEGSSARPFIVLGPSLGLRQETAIVVKYTNGDKEELSEGFDGEDIDDEIESTDIGAVAGVGVRIQMGGIAVEAEGRYTLGLTNLDKNGVENTKHRVATFTLGLRF